MSVLDWLFIGVSIWWVGEFIFFRNRGDGKGDATETRTFVTIFAALLLTISVAMVLQEMRRFDSMILPLQAAGFLLFATGVLLRYWGIIHLKNQFTRHVTVRDGDEIVSSGPYRILRHPLYTGLLFIGIGMALFFTSIFSAIVGGFILASVLLKRIRYEEKLLISKFGSDYEEWMNRRWRLVPYIY
ncbi:methyltransferase family protein [Jeotgalibacillus proteolyticus]|uniref:Isoprenylcysteine carboxylmethyltransferase family protein n=1 Tax=Jeotgalibacillus proteolyticus TaxID=2082395 RepID=A0A2S5GCF3_9BACL|nr:isoprenylcysteine carboxylmethyltransferase family protein [Jeotgalibacillus proteolyticus]PPA70628.1 isoprenylcysteine carboxylmethyltransferase family protein [Jeotgalibacillus proteolyticus]